MAALWRAADAEGYPFGRIVQMLILTGCRRDECREAEWREVDLDGRIWTIPASRTKNGNEHVIPVSNAILALLQDQKMIPRIQGVKGKPKLLFTTTGTTPISGQSKAKERLNDAMTRELSEAPEHWTLHDLRRTFATGLQRLKFPVEVAEACLNHLSGTRSGVAGIYGRHDYAAEKKTAFDAWSRHVESIVRNEPAEVIPIRRGKRRQ